MSKSETSAPPNAGHGSFAHIKDLQHKSRLVLEPFGFNASIRTLLDQVESSLSHVPVEISLQRLDRAYIEYLVSSEILLNIIPRHKDYRLRIVEHKDSNVRYVRLRRIHRDQDRTLQQIYERIVQDNLKNGTLRRTGDASRRLSVSTSHNGNQVSSVLTIAGTQLDKDELFLPKDSSRKTVISSHGHEPGRLASVNAADPLADRFSQLRLPARQSTSDRPVSTTITGPRKMPPYINNSMQVGHVAQLPRPPQPTYDPTKTPISPKLAQSRSESRTESKVSVPIKHESQTNCPPSVNRRTLDSDSDSSSRRSFISASELYNLQKSRRVLLIDVRNREEYDLGHIFSKSIICVEPVGLQFGMSAEELLDRLVTSPVEEQKLFGKLDEFDYVVYYDANTDNVGFLNGPPTSTRARHLRILHDSIFEFNDFRRLTHHPIMLMGGLEAWIDLLGAQSLTTSRTAASLHLPGTKTAQSHVRRTLSRTMTVNANSSLEIHRRRLQALKPLSEDEERRWLAQAQNEEVKPEEYEPDEQRESEEVDGQASQFTHTYNDFVQRYPEPDNVLNEPINYPQPEKVQSIYGRPSYNIEPINSTPSVPSMPPPIKSRPSYSGVSDQTDTCFSPIGRQNSASQQPLYTGRSSSLYRKLPRTGLVNFGVTCYMNATVQCLLATIPLSQFFLGENWRELVQKNWKGSNGVLPGIFANLIRSLWKDDNRPIRPKSLRALCARLKDTWGVERQQDAKEFFDFLIDCLHEDLNENHTRTALDPLTMQQERMRESMPITRAAKIEWDRYNHREKSYISNLFAGQHASRLRCRFCNQTSTTYEAFYSISVEIPRPLSSSSIKRTSNARDIQTCLRSYCQEENLSGEEVWKCPHCKREREATKQIILTRAPNFLLLHLKRFEMRRGDARKIHTPVSFPLTGLDLGPYMASDATPEGDHCASPPFIYDAYAVLRHVGNTANGGHYIALVRDAARSCWRRFDDDRVEDFDPAKLKAEHALQNEQAYLIFYQRTTGR